MEDELIDLRCQVIADRFAQQALWANFMRFTEIPMDKAAAVARQSVAALATSIDKGINPAIREAVIGHHQRFWDGLLDQYVEQQLPREE